MELNFPNLRVTIMNNQNQKQDKGGTSYVAKLHIFQIIVFSDKNDCNSVLTAKITHRTHKHLMVLVADKRR